MLRELIFYEEEIEWPFIRACRECGSRARTATRNSSWSSEKSRNHLKTLPGFLHLTWWVHPQDPAWYNEISFWTSFEALKDWHMNTYHKHAKAWAVRSGAIMEDIITNFELKNTRLIRVCPCCAQITDQALRSASASKRCWRSPAQSAAFTFR